MDQDLFVDRLKYVMDKKGMTQADLARATGLLPPRISDYLKKRYMPKHEALLTLANAVNVSIEWLSGEDVPQKPPTPSAVIAGVASVNPIKIPVLGEIAGGVPIEALQAAIDPEDPDSWEEIPIEWTVGGKEFFALKVSGDSMEPEIQNGTIAIIEKCYEWHNGAVMAVYVNGYNATLKKVKIEPNGILSLIPFNHQHETRVFTPEEVDRVPVRPLGLLVETRKKWKK